MKNLLNTIKIIGIAAVFAVAVSYVSAFTQPTVAPGSSASNVPAPIHTGASIQEKKGGIWSKNLLAAPLSIFKTNVYFPGKDSALRIGSNPTTAGTQEFDGGTATLPLNTALFGENNTIPLTIDLQSRAKPQDGIEFITNASCPVVTRWTNDKAAAFEFEKTDGSKVNIIARQVRLTGSGPDANDILVGDQYGYTRWAKATVVNGAVVFDTQPTASPVPAGQCISVTDPIIPPVDVCTNITGDQATIPPHMIQSGTNCICDDGYELNGSGMCELIPEEPDIEPFIIGCFLEDTQVTLANGTKKNIQDIAVGDQLKSVSGINTVQKLLRPKLGNQSVYSINGSEEFFTANHPFLTTDGWKSLDPETTRKEIPTLTVSLMKVGDVLITESNNIIIKSIEKTTKSTDTQLYNFELDGDHTYYANGYVVHNKIPDVPGQLCDIDPSTALKGCVEFNHNYCKIPSGATQGGCVQSFVCNTDADCAVGPSIGGGLNLVNGRCLVATQTVHPADQGRKFCKW